MKVFVPFSLEEKGTKENIRNRQRTSREGLALEERGFIEDGDGRTFHRIRLSMKPQSLDGMAHRTGWTISAARKVHPNPKDVRMMKARDGKIGTHADHFMAVSERKIQRVEVCGDQMKNECHPLPVEG